MAYGNMNKDAGASHAAAVGKKRSSPKISDYFSNSGEPSFSGKLNQFLLSCNCKISPCRNISR